MGNTLLLWAHFGSIHCKNSPSTNSFILISFFKNLIKLFIFKDEVVLCFPGLNNYFHMPWFHFHIQKHLIPHLEQVNKIISKFSIKMPSAYTSFNPLDEVKIITTSNRWGLHSSARVTSSRIFKIRFHALSTNTLCASIRPRQPQKIPRLRTWTM